MTVHPRICLATCDLLAPDGDADDKPLAQELLARGADVEVRSWSDTSADWDRFDVTVLRSTWDYTARRDDFLAWLTSTPRVHNPEPVVRSNSDKTYLRDLAAAGFPVIETAWVEPGGSAILPTSGQYVVKPSVGAGSRGAGRFDADTAGSDERALRHLASLHAAGRTAMIQPYQAMVDQLGESALVHIDGVFSHAVRKGPMLERDVHHAVDGQALYIAENITPRPASPGEIALGARVMEHLAEQFDGPLLYARVDLIPTADGPVVLELELTEPSLFLQHADGAAGRLAEAVLARVG